MREKLVKEITNYVFSSKDNRHKDSDKMFFDEPLVGFASAEFEIFNEYKKIRLEIKIKEQDPMHKVELYYNELEKTSVNKFLLYDDSDIDLELLKEIEEAINYFLLDIEGITNTMFSVVTNETKLIDKLKQLGYVDNTGFINAYDNPNVGEYLLEKKLT